MTSKSEDKCDRRSVGYPVAIWWNGAVAGFASHFLLHEAASDIVAPIRLLLAISAYLVLGWLPWLVIGIARVGKSRHVGRA